MQICQLRALQGKIRARSKHSRARSDYSGATTRTHKFTYVDVYIHTAQVRRRSAEVGGGRRRSAEVGRGQWRSARSAEFGGGQQRSVEVQGTLEHVKAIGGESECS